MAAGSTIHAPTRQRDRHGRDRRLLSRGAEPQLSTDRQSLPQVGDDDVACDELDQPADDVLQRTEAPAAQ